MLDEGAAFWLIHIIAGAGCIMENYYVALVETASNQSYIFQSNKLREVLGASELVRQAGTDFVEKAIEKKFKGAHEVVVKTSGKAVVKFQNLADAEDFVFRVTRHALEHAPGLGVFGAVGKVKTGDTAKDAAALMRNLFEKVGKNRLKLADPSSRFAHHPIIAPCKTSGLPAAGFFKGAEISVVANAKRKAAEAAIARLKRVFSDIGDSAYSPEDLEKDCNWLGVVHADGNGFGQIFMNLDQYFLGQTADGYFAFYNQLSKALDDVGKEAIQMAAAALVSQRIKENKRDKALPLMPLVMGGDDLTVIVDGAYAVDFTRAYAKAFEELVDGDPCIKGITERHAVKFGVGAGVAIVKPHHPFHRAYDLADELIKSAKATKNILGRGASSLDFHVAFGDSASDLETLRAAWKTEDDKRTAKLTARPYVLSGKDRFMAGADFKWAENHAISTLDTARAELAKKTERNGNEVPTLPRSQQHVLRDALFEGATAADAQLELIRHRYEDVKFGLFGSGKSLFFADGQSAATRLLDAMEMNDVCGEPSVKNESGASNA